MLCGCGRARETYKEGKLHPHLGGEASPTSAILPVYVAADKRLSTIVALNDTGPGGLAIHKHGGIFIAAMNLVRGTGLIVTVKPDGTGMQTIIPATSGWFRRLGSQAGSRDNEGLKVCKALVLKETSCRGPTGSSGIGSRRLGGARDRHGRREAPRPSPHRTGGRGPTEDSAPQRRAGASAR